MTGAGAARAMVCKDPSLFTRQHDHYKLELCRTGTLEHPPGVLEGVAQLGAAEGGGERVVADGDVLLGVVSLDGALEQGQGVFRYSGSNLYSPSRMYRPILINIVFKFPYLGNRSNNNTHGIFSLGHKFGWSLDTVCTVTHQNFPTTCNDWRI